MTIEMPEKTKPELDLQTATQAVDFVYSNLMDVSRIQVFYPVIVAYVFWGQVAPWIIVLWCVASCLIYVSRMLLTLQYRKRSVDEIQPWKWGNRFAATSLVSGVLWGSAAWLFYVPESQTALVLLYVLIVGTAAGAVMISCYWLQGYLFYAVPSVLLTALSLFYNGDRNENILGVMICLLLLMLVGVAFKSRDQAYTGIRLRFENLDLIDRLAEEKARAEDANRAKTQFLASANHDLRQPVHALSLLSYSLKEELVTDRGKTVYTQLSQTVSNLNNLLESLLDLSQLESGALKLDKTDISVLELAENLKSEFLSLCSRKGLAFKVESIDRYVHSDSTLLLRLLRNLLTNAVRYTDSGEVSLSFLPQGGNLEIQVRDTGIGIREEDQKNVFREFFQVGNVARNSDEGLGLGLSICRKIAVLLDLELAMSSTHGEGTLFTVTLPLSEPLVPQRNSTIECVDEIDLRGKHVLLVDDDLIGLAAMSQVLTSLGVDTTLAQSSSRAHELIGDIAHIDLIISDFRLSEEANGVDLINSLRKQPGLSCTPALIITGDTAPNVLDLISSTGIPILHKPVDIGELQRKLKLLIEDSTAEDHMRVPEHS